jgi:hypothetical protein
MKRSTPQVTMKPQVNCVPVKPAAYDATFMVKPGFRSGGAQPIRPASANYGTGKK